MKRVILVHGWGDTPVKGWFPWLRRELEARGFEVAAPQLPDAETPHVDAWVRTLSEAAGTPDKDMYFVGHSMGCQTIARYLATLPAGQNVGGAVFVAGFLNLPLIGLETDAEKEIDWEWMHSPYDLDATRAHLPQSFALFSDDDPWVPVKNAEVFEERLGSEVLVVEKQNHFNESSGFKELPIVLEKLLEMAS